MNNKSTGNINIRLSRAPAEINNEALANSNAPQLTLPQQSSSIVRVGQGGGNVVCPAVEESRDGQKIVPVGDNAEATPGALLNPPKDNERRNPLIEAISPFPTGVTIFGVKHALLMPYVVGVTTCLALESSNALGIPMPMFESVTSLFSGRVRQLEQARALAAAYPCNTTNVQHVIKYCDAQGKLHWVSIEGQRLLLSYLEEVKGCLILELEINGPIKPTLVQGLIQINNAAQKFGVCVFIVLSIEGASETSLFRDVCDDYIEVAQCEPDGDSDSAFSFDCVSLRSLNGLGVGKTMCSVKLADGLFNRRYDQFISGCLESRAIWFLRSQGKTLDEIGVILDMNKSSVLRRLQSLPPIRRLDKAPDWLHPYLESLQVIKGDLGSDRRPSFVSGGKG